MTDEEYQDLKRENFNLKLRIYFLEEQNQISVTDNTGYQSSTSYIQQLSNENEGFRRRVQTPPEQATYNFDYDDERRALREELEKYRRETEFLRKSLQQLNSNKTHGDEREKLTTTTVSVDSGFGTVMPGMSSTFLSSNATLQFELNESRERERKLDEKIKLLQKQLESSIPQANETIAELDRARRKIQEYELDIRNYEQRQTKAERVLQRLQTEYEARIAHLVEQQQQQLADFETYRHEQEQTSPTVNIEEYQQAIDNRDRIIQQLEEAINEITIRLRTPFTLMLPSSSTTSGWTDERSQNLIHELNMQMKVHLETVDQLRAECVELRRGETNLRDQINSLTHLINTPIRNPGLPPLPRPSIKVMDTIEDAQQVEDLQNAVVQITLQLQSDAENVSGLTNRVAQIIRDRDEWQDKINRLQQEIDEKNVLIRQLEKREPEVESRIRQQFLLQIEILQRDIKTLQEQIKDRDRLLNEYKTEKEEILIKTRRDYEKFDNVYHQEKQNLQGQLQTANEHLIDLDRQLEDERRRFDDLQRNYEKIKSSAGNEVEQMEREIQQQRMQIEDFNLQIREVENHFQLERQQIERERDFEKGKNIEIQNALELNKRRLMDLQVEYDQLQSSVDKSEEQIRIYQNRIAQLDRERDHSDDEVLNLRRENQVVKERSREIENKIVELTRKNDEFKSQISIYEIRFRDNEDRGHEINEWKRKYETIKTDLNNVRYEKERIESENQIINNENIKLKHDIDELEIRIRLEIQQEYEGEYRQLIMGKETDVQNIQRDNEFIRYDLEQLNNEKTRLGDRLRTVENSLKQANETIESYETDMDRLRQALMKSEKKNEEIEQDISHAYIEELKMKTDRLQDLENKYRSTEIQLNESEKILNNLRQENAKLIEYNEHLQHEYRQYQIDQQNSYDILQRNVDDATEKNLTVFDERVRKEIIQTTKNKQELIDKLENELREKDKKIKELQHARTHYESKDLKLELEIQIEQLEQQVELKEQFIKTYSDTVQDKEHQIEKLLVDIQQGDTNTTSYIETLREELQTRERQIEQILNEKNSAINEFEHRISELQGIIRDQERQIRITNDKLQQTEQNFDIQQRELQDYHQKRDRLTIDLNIAVEENEAHLDRIKLLEKQLEMSQNRNTTSDQLAHYQNIIDDLKSKLRQREDSVQSLQRTIADSDRDLRETRLNHSTIQGDYNRIQLRYEQMEKRYTDDLENRDQMIASLRKKIAEKDQEINKLRDNDINKEALINTLRSRSRESEPDSRSEYSGARAPTNVELKLQLRQKDEQIDELQRQLDRARKEQSPSGRDDSSAVQYAERVQIRRRSQSNKFDHLNREELLYELEMALQDNEGLIQQLAKKSPNITELHNQLLDIRKELARQKYVNQVLWRKLDALIDIHGSNTRTELAIELANYHEELEALKAKQHRISDARTAILNPISRSSSGLTNPSSDRQRRFSSEDFNQKSSAIIKSNEKNDQFYDNKNIEDLQEIIRNQNKYIQQLQIRIRINTSDIIHTSTSDKLTEQNKNLNLINDTCKKELKNLYKTIEFNRITLQKYENVIKQQRNYIEQINQKFNKYEQLSKKRVLSEQNRNTPDDLIINVNIDILPLNDKKKQTSLNKKDSGVESVVDSTRYNLTQQEYQRQINDKDDQIKQLTKQLNDLKKVHENEISQYRLRPEKAQTELIDDLESKQNDLRQARLQIDLLKSTKTQLEQAQTQLIDDLESKQNDLRQARLQIDLLKSTKTQLEQAQDQNQRLQNEIKLLQNELTNKKDLIIHYEKQISLLEQQISSRGGSTGEMSIRTSEMSELLEEMRRLRRDLERSINKQNELQAKLDENIRSTRTPREFTFSGRGVSYPDLRIIDGSGLVGTENLSFTSINDEKRSRPVGSSTTELLETEIIHPVKMYIVGELENHENLRRLIADLKIEFKALEVKIQDKLQSKFTSTLTEPSIEWLEHRLKSVTQCLAYLEETYQLIESYWKADLPVKNKYDEHPFIDPRLANENRELKLSQSKYLQELHNIRKKFKEQSIYMDQVLAQLTKANNKKANADDYLALLLRPTLDALQKARSNMEHHLKESNNTNNILSDSLQSYHRQRTNRLD